MTHAFTIIDHAFKKVLDFVLPPRCVECLEDVSYHHGLCAVCWQKINFISKPICVSCGLPFELHESEENSCGVCLREKHSFDKARSALYYDDASKGMILRFKHSDATHLTPLFVHWLYNAGKDVLSQANYITPVLLHWTRLVYRSYNQAALLSRGLSKKTGISNLPNLLLRYRRTPSQGTFNTKERQSNVHNAFDLSHHYKNLIKNKKIVLIDDVFTSGATVQACASILKKHGALTVNVLTLARVTKRIS